MFSSSLGTFGPVFSETIAKQTTGTGFWYAGGITLTPESQQAAIRALVPQEPLFSLAGLVFRPKPSGSTDYLDFFWARNAIFHGLRALGIQPKEKVLVPAYLCN